MYLTNHLLNFPTKKYRIHSSLSFPIFTEFDRLLNARLIYRNKSNRHLSPFFFFSHLKHPPKNNLYTDTLLLSHPWKFITRISPPHQIHLNRMRERHIISAPCGSINFPVASCALFSPIVLSPYQMPSFLSLSLSLLLSRGFETARTEYQSEETHRVTDKVLHSIFFFLRGNINMMFTRENVRAWACRNR